MIKSMGMFTSVIRQEAGNNLVLYSAVARDGQYFYAYIRCDKKQYHKMRYDFITQSACKDITCYGEVVYIALGKKPDIVAEDFLVAYLRTM